MSSCPFCSPESDRVVMESDVAIAFPDAYPVADGHTLVVPRQHVSSIYELPTQAQAELWAMVAKVRTLLMERLRPDAFNIGVNDGVAAGQTVEHAHVHVVPRRAGDVADPRGGVRWIFVDKADYWSGR